jgi:hypothetical protein
MQAPADRSADLAVLRPVREGFVYVNACVLAPNVDRLEFDTDYRIDLPVPVVDCKVEFKSRHMKRARCLVHTLSSVPFDRVIIHTITEAQWDEVRLTAASVSVTRVVADPQQAVLGQAHALQQRQACRIGHGVHA